MNAPAFMPGAATSGAAANGVWNALVSHAGAALPLVTRGSSAAFALAEAPPPERWAVALDTAEGLRLYAVLGEFPFRPMFNVELGAEDLAGLPPDLRDALFEGVLALVSGALPERTPGPLRVTGSGALGTLVATRNPAELQWFSLSFQGLAPGAVLVEVGCDRDALLARLARDLDAPRPVWGGLRTQIVEIAHHTLGSLGVTVAALSGLEPGAMIVLPVLEPDVASVRVRDVVTDFRYAGGGWQVIGSARERYRRLSEGSEMDADSPDTGLANLPVVLDFDIGRQTVALAELESWQAGTVVALDPPARAEGVEVTIRANGAVIGSGDLVRVDDRLAIRLSRVSFKG